MHDYHNGESLRSLDDKPALMDTDDGQVVNLHKHTSMQHDMAHVNGDRKLVDGCAFSLVSCLTRRGV